MKYWSYLAAKVVVALAILCGLERGIAMAFPPLKPFYQGGPNPVMRYLNYTFVMLLFWLFAGGMAWLIVWDQRYRCRTCLRRLRMPIQTGSWTHILLGAPRTEYICPYGHGTLKVAEIQIAGHQGADWQPHEDMWKELFSLEDTKK
jgi:hypothetical protein